MMTQQDKDRYNKLVDTIDESLKMLHKDYGSSFILSICTVEDDDSAIVHSGCDCTFKEALVMFNDLSEEEWMNSFGHVYKTLIDNGLDAIMGGHIMMKTYMQGINPDIKDDELLPATLCPEIMTGLLRDKLGFNGMVVTDASHMVGITDRMTRKEMLPASINAGCDMFLFFNDPDEDFATM